MLPLSRVFFAVNTSHASELLRTHHAIRERVTQAYFCGQHRDLARSFSQYVRCAFCAIRPTCRLERRWKMWPSAKACWKERATGIASVQRVTFLSHSRQTEYVNVFCHNRCYLFDSRAITALLTFSTGIPTRLVDLFCPTCFECRSPPRLMRRLWCAEHLNRTLS